MEKSEMANHLEGILKDEPPLHRHEQGVYISVVRGYFVQIQTLRKQGYRFIHIYRVLMKNGELPIDAKARYFRQAYRRECLKHEEDGILIASLRGGSKQAVKKTAEMPMKKEIVNATALPTVEMSEEERRKKLGLGRPIYTGTGMIIKNTDGSFDFD